MNFENLCDDLGIETWTRGWKFCTKGWVQVECPFCTGSAGPHLGWNLDHNFFNCWRCGWHSTPHTLTCLTGLGYDEVRLAIARHAGRPTRLREIVEEPNKACALPPGATELTQTHTQYLVSRNCDSSVADTWGLKACGPFGRYKFRIIAPIYYNGRLVSYQGRDHTNNSGLKYKACAQEDEAIDHQKLLYGYDLVPSKKCVIVVEGIIDAWRIGPGCVATFGMDWCLSQAKLLKTFKRRLIMYDGEKEAQRQACKLAKTLSMYGGVTEVIEPTYGTDPAQLSDKEVRALRMDAFGE